MNSITIYTQKKAGIKIRILIKKFVQFLDSNYQRNNTCNGLLTATKCVKVVKKLENNKPPRYGGFKAEFINASGPTLIKYR